MNPAMETTLPEAVAPTRALRLRQATHAAHEMVDQTIMRARPFAAVENYGTFLKVQYAFHRDVLPLYSRADLLALIPDLGRRSRLDAVMQDAADLNIALPSLDNSPATDREMSVAEALGWLYVIEGSNLGAAILFKAALKMGLSEEHGARHLAQAPEGRAEQWRNFTSALNAVELSAGDETAAVAGAEAAFEAVNAYVRQYMP